MSTLNNKRATVIRASSASTATHQSTAFGVGDEDVVVLLDVTAVSGTSPSMTVNVEWSVDGSTWYVGDTADNFTAITAAKKTSKIFVAKGLYARLNCTVTGTTPSFTYSATAVTKE